MPGTEMCYYSNFGNKDITDSLRVLFVMKEGF